MKSAKKQTLSLEEFITKSNNIHNFKYNYNLANYKNYDLNIKIICPIHGEFEQRPGVHLRGSGCPKCVLSRGWKRSDWINFCKEKNKNSYLYFIELQYNREKFYKIGITTDLNNRLKGYDKFFYNILYNNKFSPEITYDLEKFILKKYYKNKYYPLVKFDGYTECFKRKEPILNYLKNIKF